MKKNRLNITCHINFLQILSLIKGTVFTPTDTFKMLAEEANWKKYLPWILGYLITIPVINLIYSFVITSFDNTAITVQMKQFQVKVRIFQAIAFPFLLFINSLLINWLGKKKNGKDKLPTLIISQVIIGLTTLIPIYLLSFIQRLVNHLLLNIASYGIYLWVYYLNILAISLIYKVSKRISFALFLIVMIVTVILTYLISSFIFFKT